MRLNIRKRRTTENAVWLSDDGETMWLMVNSWEEWQ